LILDFYLILFFRDGYLPPIHAISQNPDYSNVEDAPQQDESHEEVPDWGINYRADPMEVSAPNQYISTRDLIGWSIQIAQGMDYLAKKKVTKRSAKFNNHLG